LSENGDIKDLEDVWKKWKGKEPDMFLALASKYKDKAVEIREKPKPKPYKPPADSEAADPAADPAEEATPSEEAPAPPTDPEGDAYLEKRRQLNEKKRKASQDEDYDLALSINEELKEAKDKEMARLKAVKNKAIEEEDFITAKAVKARIAKLEL